MVEFFNGFINSLHFFILHLNKITKNILDNFEYHRLIEFKCRGYELPIVKCTNVMFGLASDYRVQIYSSIWVYNAWSKQSWTFNYMLVMWSKSSVKQKPFLYTIATIFILSKSTPVSSSRKTYLSYYTYNMNANVWERACSFVPTHLFVTLRIGMKFRIYIPVKYERGSVGVC